MPSETSPSLLRLRGLDRSDRVQTYAEVHARVRRVQAALEERHTDFDNHQHWRLTDLEDVSATLPSSPQIDAVTLSVIR